MAVHDHAVIRIDAQPRGIAQHVRRKLRGESAAIRNPQSSCAFAPPSASRTSPRFTSGAYCTFLKYLPVPVTRKNLPSSAGQEKPVGISRTTRPGAR